MRTTKVELMEALCRAEEAAEGGVADDGEAYLQSRLSHRHEGPAVRILEELVGEKVFDGYRSSHELDRAGVDMMVFNYFPHEFNVENRRTREFRLFIQFKASVEHAAAFAQLNPCVIPWVVNNEKCSLEAKVELLRSITDWLMIQRNQYVIDFFRNHLSRYEAMLAGS